MSLRTHIVLMLTTTVLAWISWLLVLVYVNPRAADFWGFFIFYASLFLSLFGTFTVLGFVVRSVVTMRRRTETYRVGISVRQSLLWSSALIIALMLQSQRVLTWWIFTIVLIVFGLLEFIFMSMQFQSDSNKHG